MTQALLNLWFVQYHSSWVMPFSHFLKTFWRAILLWYVKAVDFPFKAQWVKTKVEPLSAFQSLSLLMATEQHNCSDCRWSLSLWHLCSCCWSKYFSFSLGIHKLRFLYFGVFETFTLMHQSASWICHVFHPQPLCPLTKSKALSQLFTSFKCCINLTHPKKQNSKKLLEWMQSCQKRTTR